MRTPKVEGLVWVEIAWDEGGWSDGRLLTEIKWDVGNVKSTVGGGEEEVDGRCLGQSLE